MREFLTNHMRKSGINRLVCAGLGSLMLAGGLALQPAAVGQVVITVAPPAPVVETVPVSPGLIGSGMEVITPGEVGSTCGYLVITSRNHVPTQFG